MLFDAIIPLKNKSIHLTNEKAQAIKHTQPNVPYPFH